MYWNVFQIQVTLISWISPGRIKSVKKIQQKEIHPNAAESAGLPHLKLDFLYRSQISWTNYKLFFLISYNNSTFFPTNVFGSTFGEIIGILLPWTIFNTLPAGFSISTWFQISISSSKTHSFMLATLALDLLYYFPTLLLLRGSFGKIRRPNTSLKMIVLCNPFGCSKGSLHTSL